MTAEKTSAQDTAPPESPTWALLGFAMICGVLGLGFRLDGLGDSLWLDEFGTLWAVEGGLGTVMERVYEFHGQTPFYYVWPWLSIQLFGESEAALRLPSVGGSGPTAAGPNTSEKPVSEMYSWVALGLATAPCSRSTVTDGR